MWRRIARVAAVLVALAAIVFVVVRLYVGSDRGRHAVERKIDETVGARLGGRVQLGAIRGTLVGGVTLDDVVWRDDAGAVVLRARRVVARWSAARALARRPAIDLRVEAPEVDLDRLFGGAVDLDAAARLLTEKRDAVDAVTLGRLDVVDGTVRAGGQTLRGLSLRGSARLDKAPHLGDAGELRLERLQARAELAHVPFALSAGGALRWDRRAGRIEAERLRLGLGHSAVVLDGHAARDGVDLRLVDLRVAPDDLRKLSPLAHAPRTPLSGYAHAHGPLGRVVIAGALVPDRGRVVVDGTLDVRARTGRLVAHVDDVETDYTPAVVRGTVTVAGGLDGGVLALGVDGDGTYFRRVVDPNLPPITSPVERRAVATVRPGGRFHGRGRLEARIAAHAPTATLRLRLAVDDPGHAARLLAGPDLRNAPRPLVVDGVWTRPPHGAATLTLHRRAP